MKSAAVVLLVLTVTIVASVAVLAQSSTAEEKARVPVEFPGGWIGTYRGEYVVHYANGKRQDLVMEFTVAPTDRKDRVKWIIGYEGQPKRNYELVTIDAKRRLYKIDEKNSIEIMASLVGGELVSVFSVQGSQLLARYRLQGDELTYETVVWGQGATALTGGRNGIPVVQTFTPLNIQKGVLKRVKDVK